MRLPEPIGPENLLEGFDCGNAPRPWPLPCGRCDAAQPGRRQSTAGERDLRVGGYVQPVAWNSLLSALRLDIDTAALGTRRLLHE